MATKRLERFHAYADHAWLWKSYSKLTKQERDLAESFIVENDGLDKGSFELKVNRMFIDRPDRPKNWTIILELLTNANSAYEKEKT